MVVFVDRHAQSTWLQAEPLLDFDMRLGEGTGALLAVPIILGWVLLTVVTNVAVPSLEKVGEEHTVGLSARDAPSMVSMKRIGADFEEFDSDSNAMVVLEGEQPLGGDAHRYYDGLVDRLEGVLF